MAPGRARRAVARGVVEDEHLGLERQRRALTGDRVQAAHEQLALLGVDHAEGDLHTHDGPRYCRPWCASTSSTPRPTRRPTTMPCAPPWPARAPTCAWSRALPYGPVPGAAGYERDERFYRGGARRRACASRPSSRSTCPTCCATARAARAADVVHFQWLAVQPLDVRLLPLRPPARPHRPRRAAARAAPRPARRPAPSLRPRRRGRRALRARPRAARRGARRGPGQGRGDPARRLDSAPMPAARAAAARAGRRSPGPSSCSSACCAPTRGSTCCSRRGAGSPTPSCGWSGCRAWTRPRCTPRRRPACAGSSVS